MIRMLKDANDQLERELANNKVTDITDKIRETFTELNFICNSVTW